MACGSCGCWTPIRHGAPASAQPRVATSPTGRQAEVRQAGRHHAVGDALRSPALDQRGGIEGPARVGIEEAVGLAAQALAFVDHPAHVRGDLVEGELPRSKRHTAGRYVLKVASTACSQRTASSIARWGPTPPRTSEVTAVPMTCSTWTWRGRVAGAVDMAGASDPSLGVLREEAVHPPRLARGIGSRMRDWRREKREKASAEARSPASAPGFVRR